VPVNTTDTSGTGNNTATDTDTIIAAPEMPALTLRDNFNRANANTLGGNWSQQTLFGNAAIRVNNNRAYAIVLGSAIWNSPSGGYGNRQGAAFNFTNAPANGLVLPSLILKATGGSSANPANYILVSYQHSTGLVTVSTVTSSGTVLRASLPATFAAGNTLSATAFNDGKVFVYKNGVALGGMTIPTSGGGAWTQGTGGGRIGIRLPTSQRVDDFSGGTVP
jgi:hypothetical protein